MGAVMTDASTPTPRSVGDDLLAAAFSGRPASQLPIAIVSSGVGEMLRARAAAERRAKR
jgi:hypothetical protein